jgi:hypothetical protein
MMMSGSSGMIGVEGTRLDNSDAAQLDFGQDVSAASNAFLAPAAGRPCSRQLNRSRTAA